MTKRAGLTKLGNIERKIIYRLSIYSCIIHVLTKQLILQIAVNIHELEIRCEH